MANTADLIALQAEYPTAFVDPEATPPEATGAASGEAIAPNIETMHPDQVMDFVEGHLRAAQTEPDEECCTGETEQKGDDITYSQSCLYCIGRISHDSRLLAIAADYLEKLADIARMNRDAASKKYHEKAGGLPPRPLSHVVDEVSAPILVNDFPKIIESKITRIRERPGIVIDLPETHARQGTAECPGGLCPLD